MCDTELTQCMDDKKLTQSMQENKKRNGKLSTQVNKQLHEEVRKRAFSVEGAIGSVLKGKEEEFNNESDYNHVESTVQMDYLNYDHNCNLAPNEDPLTPVTDKVKLFQDKSEKPKINPKRIAQNFVDIELVVHQWKLDLVQTFFTKQQTHVMSKPTVDYLKRVIDDEMYSSPSSGDPPAYVTSVADIVTVPVTPTLSCVSPVSSLSAVSSLADESCTTIVDSLADDQDISCELNNSSNQSSFTTLPSHNFIASPRRVFSPSAPISDSPVLNSTPEKQQSIEVSNVTSPDNLVLHSASNLAIPHIPPLSKLSLTHSSSLLSLSPESQISLHAQAVSTPEQSSVPSIRPQILHKYALSPNPSVPINHVQDQGSNCVSVIIKSNSQEQRSDRMRAVKTRLQQVEQLVCRFNIKFDQRSSPGVQLRLDYCFHLPEEARQFFKAVHDLLQSPPKLLPCILLSDSDLGYQHLPVLTEQDLLAIQSSSYCMNLFRTSLQIRVVQEEDMVAYKFESVADVNMFLFNKSGDKCIKSLGQLRQVKVTKEIFPDEEGFFRLSSSDSTISSNKKFKVKPKLEDGGGSSPGGHLLLFSSKLHLFQFLISEQAALFETLKFDETLIKNCGKPVRQADKQESDKERVADVAVKPKVDTSKVEINGTGLPKVKQADVTVSSEKCGKDDYKIEISAPVTADEEVLRLAVAKKEEEIKTLKMKLMVKDKLIGKTIVSKRDIDSKLKKVLAQLDRIHSIAPPSSTAGNTSMTEQSVRLVLPVMDSDMVSGPSTKIIEPVGQGFSAMESEMASGPSTDIMEPLNQGISAMDSEMVSRSSTNIIDI